MQVTANGIAIEVDERGPAGGEPLLLVMGLGMQLVAWPEPFVDALVERGFRVIRFDNRDVGLSQPFDHLGVPNVLAALLKSRVGLPFHPPYTLDDMARDAVGVLDALGIGRAHICGASMGGMIAQHVAARFPTRTRSVTLVMTTTGSRRLPKPSLHIRSVLIRPPSGPRDEAGIVAHYMRLYRMIGSPAYPPEDEALRRRVTAAVRRSFRPHATMRQLAAIIADGDRSSMVRLIQAPTQVIHGAADPLVPLAGGRDLARKIDGAQIDEVPGMGHDLPEALFGRIADDIAAVARRSAG